MTAPVETSPAGETPEANPAPATPATPAPSPANMPQTSAAAAPTTEVEPTDESKADTEESARLAKLGRENAKYRTERNELQQRLAAIEAAQAAKDAELAEAKDWKAKVAALLNPEANEPPDPAKLAEQLAAKDAEIERVRLEMAQENRSLRVDNALQAAMVNAKADPVLTEAVLKTSGALKKLDPTSDTFTADLVSAVNDALEANPRLKVEAPVAQTRKSGAEIPGRSGGQNQLSLEQVRSMKPAELDKARREGRLTSLGIGPG